jgi:hypothetical protein
VYYCHLLLLVSAAGQYLFITPALGNHVMCSLAASRWSQSPFCWETHKKVHFLIS